GRVRTRALDRPRCFGLGQVVEQAVQVRLRLGLHRPVEALVELLLVEPPVPVVLGQAVGDLRALSVGNPQVWVGPARAAAKRSAPPWRIVRRWHGVRPPWSEWTGLPGLEGTAGA